MDRRDLIGKVALVTGAGSGIGRETVLALARAGAELVLCDVNEVGLSGVAAEVKALGREVFAKRVDVAVREEMRAFAAEVHQRYPALDILVNNAGVGLGGKVADTSLEDWDWILSINLMGVIHGCHFFVPPMVARGQWGHVVNLSSVAGFVASPMLPAYSVTKFGVFGLSEALRAELWPHGIGVSTICPGVINTPIVHSSRGRGAMGRPEIHARVVELFNKRGYGPEKVAESILQAIVKNKAVVPVSPEAWAVYLLKRFTPGLVAFFGRRMAASITG